MISVGRIFLTLLLLFTSGCSFQGSHQNISNSYQLIDGRDEGDPAQRTAIYRVKVPKDWVRKDPGPDESILDSTKALCEFRIIDRDEQIRISVHNFPVETLEQRIAPFAQITRWKKQFDSLANIDTKTIPQAFAGYAGLMFEATGLIKGRKTTVLAWSMQLAPEHFRNLSSDNHASIRQKRADFTIKAVGPPSLMDKYKPAILNFAKSFELIEEIPVRT